MADAQDTSLPEVLRGLVKQTMDAYNLADILFGVVVNTKPLTINVEQRFTITEEFLILTKNVKKYTTTATINWTTEEKSINANHNHSATVQGDCSITIQQENINLAHNHSINGTKSITINNELKQNDKVILVKASGGQKYVVLDKVV